MYGDHEYYWRRHLKLAERQASLGQAQVDELRSLGSSMDQLASEMAGLRHGQAATAALQQEILDRDVIQAGFEEFIYQLEKQVRSFQDPSSPPSPSWKALILRELLLDIKDRDISTRDIRGRENKAAFEKCLREAESLYTQLRLDPAVSQSIADEEAEERAEKVRQEVKKNRENEQKHARVMRQRIVCLSATGIVLAVIYYGCVGLAFRPRSNGPRDLTVKCAACGASYSDKSLPDDQPFDSRCPFCGHITHVKSGSKDSPARPEVGSPFGPLIMMGLIFLIVVFVLSKRTGRPNQISSKGSSDR